MILATLFFLFVPQPADTAESIMARVAENQDRAEQMRTSYVYHQNVLVRLQRYNGKFTREEYSEFTVTPNATGTKKTRTHFLGKYASHGKVIDYDNPGYQYKAVDIDGPLAQSLADSMSNNDKTKDGLAHDLFPLTAKEQKQYSFHLEGTQDYHGIPVYRITFESGSKD